MAHRRLQRAALVAGVLVVAFAGPGAIAAADEGVIAYGRLLESGGAAIQLIDPDGSGLAEVTVPDIVEDFGLPTWAPDASRLLISNILVLDGNGECCAAFRPATVEPDGSSYNLIDPAGAPVDMYCHAWSGDGQRILCGVGGETPGIFSFRATDGGDARRLTTSPFGAGDVAWSISPDGSRFAFIRYRPGAEPDPRPFHTQQVGIFTADADGSNVRQVVPYGIAMAHELASVNWSPDGNRLIAATKHGRLFTVRIDGMGLRTVSLDLDNGYFAYQPDWSPSGDRIVFGMFVDGQPDLYVADIDGSNVSQITDSPDLEDGPDWAAPGG